MMLCLHPTKIMGNSSSVIIEPPLPTQDLTSIGRVMWCLENRVRVSGQSVVIASDT